MLNNDVFRRVRYALDLNDSKLVEIFGKADKQVTRDQIALWLSRPDDPGFVECNDSTFALFLDGLITDRRGEGSSRSFEPVTHLTNNMIFKKLRIALSLETDDILQLMKLAGYTMGRHELSSFFRNPGNRRYRECTDQTLRKFLKGMQLKFRPSTVK